VEFPSETDGECGSHGRWTPSYDAVRPVPPQRFNLPALPGVPAIHATALDRFSRCPFTALASARWRLRDAREPEAELWPDVRGELLHAAVKILVEARDPEGFFFKSPEVALEEAWREVQPGGLLRGERLRSYARATLVTVLAKFCEKERAYVQRANTSVLSLEGPEVRLEFPAFSVNGRPDRIDAVDGAVEGSEPGLFVLDYKSSSVLPKGNEMLEGYRLQLPFYAVAAARHFGRAALGVQYVELNRKGGRGNGIFFKQLNGKEAGKLTNSRSRSSVLDLAPEEVWSLCVGHIEKCGKAFCAGEFAAAPAKEIECRSCMFSDLCGRRRAAAVSEEETDGD